MRGLRRVFRGLPAMAVVFMVGCQTAGMKRPSTVITPAPAPAVTDVRGGESVAGERMVSETPVRSVAFADRHPLFRKPRQYYDSAGDNKFVKVARATFIGVPAGFVGEVKQIFTGVPPDAGY